jgi:7-carboxy-7-deazaguanine synthase
MDTINIQIDGKTLAQSVLSVQQQPRPKTILISEIFGIVCQGEGMVAGRPTVFVRTAGCDYRCSWCDSYHAVLPEFKASWRKVQAEDIVAEVNRLSPQPILVTISGGNPALQNLELLINLLHQHGHQVCLETQGSIYRPWFNLLDYLSVSPKPPSSGMETNWEILAQCILSGRSGLQRYLKVVVFDEADYRYAQEVYMQFPYIQMYLQPGNATPPQNGEFDLQAILKRYEWLIDKVTSDQWNDVVVLPQLHTLVYGNRQGV